MPKAKIKTKKSKAVAKPVIKSIAKISQKNKHKIKKNPEEKKKIPLINVHGETLGEADVVLSDAAIPEAILPDPVLPDIAPEDPIPGEEDAEDDDAADELADIWEE